jgi:hypothetical protein
MTTVAPVCPISRSQPVSNQPGLQLPPPPRAFDLPSLIAAVNALAATLRVIAGPGPVANNLHPPLFFGQAQINAGTEYPRWEETGMTTDDLTIYSSTDKSMYVEVERMYEVYFRDASSNGKMTWSYT